MDGINEKSELRKLRFESLKRNFNLFKQSKIGMLGLVIVLIFGLLALLQPLLFVTNIWDEATYHPVVGYDSQKILATVVSCKNIDYPTPEYKTPSDCPAGDEVNIVTEYAASIPESNKTTITNEITDLQEELSSEEEGSIEADIILDKIEKTE